MKYSWSCFGFLLLTVLFAFSPAAAHAQTLYWANFGGNWWDNNWTTSSAGTVGTQSWTNGDSAYFSASPYGGGTFSVDVNQAGTTVNNLTVAQGNVTLTDQALTLSAPTPTWSVYLGASLTVATGTLNNGGNALDVSSDNGATMDLSQVVVAGSGGLDVNGGTVILSGSNTFLSGGGNNYINAGTVVVGTPMPAGTQPSAPPATFAIRLARWAQRATVATQICPPAPRSTSMETTRSRA